MRVTLAGFFAAAGLFAQAPPGIVPMETPSERQRASVTAMEKSVARQVLSVQRQTRQVEERGFFVTPAPTGTRLVPAPAPAPDPGAVGDCAPLPSSEVDSLVQQTARRQDLDEDLLRGVIRQESAFRPCAVSPAGAMGLMQLMPATAFQFGVPDPFDPRQNVEAGATFLKQLLVRYGGDLPMALSAYNAGPAKVDAAAGIPKIPETQDYVKQIISYLPVKP